MRESVKHRLIGGAVLAAIAVLFLPSFFKDRQQYQVDTSSHIHGRPSITAVDFNEPTRPEGIEPAPAPETMFVPDESESVTTTQIPPAEDTVVGSAEASSTATVNATIYRVFIGPKQDKAEALAIKAQLDKRLKVNSLVLPFKP